jgi:hypothetical protein
VVGAVAAFLLHRKLARHPELLGPSLLQEMNGRVMTFDAQLHHKRSYVAMLQGNGATPGAVGAALQEVETLGRKGEELRGRAAALHATLQQLAQRQQYVNVLVANKAPPNDLAAARAALEQVFVEIEARASAPAAMPI